MCRQTKELMQRLLVVMIGGFLKLKDQGLEGK